MADNPRDVSGHDTHFASDPGSGGFASAYPRSQDLGASSSADGEQQQQYQRAEGSELQRRGDAGGDDTYREVTHPMFRLPGKEDKEVIQDKQEQNLAWQHHQQDLQSSLETQKHQHRNNAHNRLGYTNFQPPHKMDS